MLAARPYSAVDYAWKFNQVSDLKKIAGVVLSGITAYHLYLLKVLFLVQDAIGISRTRMWSSTKIWSWDFWIFQLMASKFKCAG